MGKETVSPAFCSRRRFSCLTPARAPSLLFGTGLRPQELPEELDTDESELYMRASTLDQLRLHHGASVPTL